MKNKILIAAIAVVVLASVAYAAFAQNLQINGTGTATGDWNVKITGITRTSGTGVTEASGPSFTDTSATFSTNLQYPGATATYSVVIENQGNIAAQLSTITNLTTINSAAPTYITYAVNGVTQGSTLAAGATATATVTVTWDAAATGTTGANKTAQIDFNYIQST
ncbi:hypothetical protein IPM09_01345 [Candidatus Saccharibacteria bacterium]|nr:MAG: hypothetical protein IPM09_01345 [Candidatus Saccharibacteria bacterium]